MYAEFYRDSALIALPLLALGLFMAVFTTMIVRVFFHRKSGTGYDEAAALPLTDDTSPLDARGPRGPRGPLNAAHPHV